MCINLVVCDGTFSAGFVMALQFRYQRAKFYKTIAMGRRHHMSVSQGGWDQYFVCNCSWNTPPCEVQEMFWMGASIWTVIAMEYPTLCSSRSVLYKNSSGP